MKYMLDTNICIYIILKKPLRILNHLKSKKNKDVSISSITLSELEYGIQKSGYPEKNKPALMGFLVPLTILPFDKLSAAEYGKISAHFEKSGRVIGAMDMLIAAHALSLNLIVVTNTGYA